jgi:hypothetical protein
MNQYQNSIVFTGKINTDVAPERIPQGDYTESRYFRVYGGVEGEVGKGQSMKGNAIIENDLPTGLNRVIGTCKYTERNSLIYFVYNSNGNHSIYMVDNDSFAITRIAQSGVFNFQEDYPILSAFVLDNKLYWTDGYFGSYQNLNWNGPRRLDINWALSGGLITREAIAWDIYQPAFDPTAVYDTDTTIPTNYLNGKLYQFRYQWVYTTGEESVFSPMSKVAIPSSSFIEGMNSYTQIVDNVINVTVFTGPEQVRYLRICYRTNAAEEFKVFRELDKQLLNIPDNSVVTEQFTRDEFLYTLPLSLKNNERFPRICETVALLPTNEAAFANFKEGYNVELPIMTVGFVPSVYEDYSGLIGFAKGQNGVSSCSIFFPPYYGQNGKFYFNKGDVINFQIYQYTDLNNPTIVVNYKVVNSYNQATNLLRWQAFLNDLVAYLLSEYGITANVEPVYQISIPNYRLRGISQEEYDIGQTIFLPVTHSTDTRKTFKAGALHQFSIQYYDEALKDGTVWRPASKARIKVPSQSEIAASYGYTTEPFSVNMVVSLGGNSGQYQPPMWASSYKIMYKPPRIEWQQRITKEMTFMSTGRVRIELEDKYEQNYKGANINYQIQVGDTVRFIRRSNNALFENQFLAEYCPTEIAEVQVREYGPSTSANGEYIVVDNFGLEYIFNPSQGPQPGNDEYKLGSNALIEIYRVNEATDNDPWYELSQMYPIANPHTANRAHQGQVLNVSPAEYTLTNGNCYFRKRPQGGYYNLSSPNAYDYQMAYIEDPDYSDYFPSRFYDLGRLGVEDVNAKERNFIAAVGHTSQYLDNTRVNRLNQVDFQNVTYLREEEGPITMLLVNGYTLSVLQWRKNTSIYINRELFLNGGGDEGLSLTDRTFSKPRPLQENWGCVHGGTAIVSDGVLYYYDYLNGIFVAAGGNGQINLSLQSSYMKGSKQLQSYLSIDNKLAFSCEKTKYNEVYWTFPNANAGVAFSKVIKGFAYTTDHPEECVGNLVNKSYSFLQGNVYADDVGSELNFNGFDKTCFVGFYFNIAPSVVKVPLNLMLQTNKRWLVDPITIPANLNYTQMESYILPEMFNAQEGYIVAGYRKDYSDPAFEDEDIAYVSGRSLRGYVIFHLLRYGGQPNTEKVYLYGAAVNFYASAPIIQ